VRAVLTSEWHRSEYEGYEISDALRCASQTVAMARAILGLSSAEGLVGPLEAPLISPQSAKAVPYSVKRAVSAQEHWILESLDWAQAEG
jgi:hypothetical protein